MEIGSCGIIDGNGAGGETIWSPNEDIVHISWDKVTIEFKKDFFECW